MLWVIYNITKKYVDIKKIIFKSSNCETWRVILVSEADIFLSESLRILAERLSQSEIGLNVINLIRKCMGTLATK